LLPSGLLHSTVRYSTELPWRVTAASTAARAPVAAEYSDTVSRVLVGRWLTSAVLATIRLPSGVIMLSGPSRDGDTCRDGVRPKFSTSLALRRLRPGAAVRRSALRQPFSTEDRT
jgi:hypothetical protein